MKKIHFMDLQVYLSYGGSSDGAVYEVRSCPCGNGTVEATDNEIKITCPDCQRKYKIQKDKGNYMWDFYLIER